jgi:RNA polymerase sigma-70 factor (sigma-E family)
VFAHLVGVNATDDVLLAKAPAGRPRLEDLYARHVGRAVGLARLLTADPSGAEDIAHDAFIKVAGRFGHLRDEGAFEAYYRRAVVNLCRARFRRARVERAYLRRSPAPVASDPAPAPEERDHLWSAVRDLPERQRTAVVLRFYEDLSEEQTAQVMRCSARAVNSLVSRALAQLRIVIPKEDR